MRKSRLFVVLLLMVQLLLGFQSATPVAATSTQNNAPLAATTFFSDDFEAATLGVAWLSSTTGNGQVQRSSDYPHSGTGNAFLGQQVAGAASASLVLPINLTGQTDVFLDFWWRATGNAPEATNGVYISDNDGVTWVQIRSLNTNSQTYGHELLNIARAAQDNGKTLNDKFRIRIFFQGTFFSNPSDGIVIDDFRLSQRAGLIATFPFAREGFEASVLQQGFYPRSSNKGGVQLSTDYPHQGTTSVFLGQQVAGAATAELELAINLAAQTDVFLDFWWRATGNAPEATNGVYISDNDGVTWVQIRSLNTNSQTYSHELLNIVSAAQANGKTLNDKFRIRIFFQGTFFSSAGDGIVLDDLQLTSRSNELAAFDFALDSFETGVFRQGMYPHSSNKGGATIRSEYPHTGAKNIWLGQDVAGAATAEVSIAINLTNQSSVFLDFWWRATGTAREATNGVYISDDDGATWSQVKSLNSNIQDYKYEVIDIVKVSAANGKTLNNKFRIRIFFQGTFFSKPTDGLAIDDLRIGTTNPDISLVYLPLVTH